MAHFLRLGGSVFSHRFTVTPFSPDLLPLGVWTKRFPPFFLPLFIRFSLLAPWFALLLFSSLGGGAPVHILPSAVWLGLNNNNKPVRGLKSVFAYLSLCRHNCQGGGVYFRLYFPQGRGSVISKPPWQTQPPFQVQTRQHSAGPGPTGLRAASGSPRILRPGAGSQVSSGSSTQ